MQAFFWFTVYFLGSTVCLFLSALLVFIIVQTWRKMQADNEAARRYEQAHARFERQQARVEQSLHSADKRMWRNP